MQKQNVKNYKNDHNEQKDARQSLNNR